MIRISYVMNNLLGVKTIEDIFLYIFKNFQSLKIIRRNSRSVKSKVKNQSS